MRLGTCGNRCGGQLRQLAYVPGGGRVTRTRACGAQAWGVGRAGSRNPVGARALLWVTAVAG